MPAITINDLNNGKLDVDHIAAIATSTGLSAVDRLGNAKDTITGAIYKITTFTNRGAWAAATSYAVKDLVSTGGAWYVSVVAHTSSAAFATDSASKWRLYQGVTTGDLSAPSGASIVGVNKPSGPAQNLQQHLDMLYFGIANVRDTQYAGGAKLDGVTNDTAAYAAAIASGKNVYQPGGNALITAGLTNPYQTQIIGNGVGTSTITVSGSGYDVITLSGSYSGISDLRFTSPSPRTGGAYIKLSAATRSNSVRRIATNNAFYGIWIADDAVITSIEDIEMQNTTSATGIGIFIDGGNDTFLTRVVMDAPAGAQPMCGVRIKESQATWMTDCDMIHQGNGIQIDPDGGAGDLITWCFFSKVACDLGTGDGLYVCPTNGGSVRGLFFYNCWFSSNRNGVNLLKTGGCAIDTVTFDNCTLFNNQYRGGWDQNASNVDYNNCRVSGNSGVSPGTYAGLEFANGTTDFSVRNTKSGAMAGFGANMSHGILIGSGCNNYIITDNNLLGNVVATMGDSSMASSTFREVRGNLGFKTVASGLATMTSGTNVRTVSHNLAGTPSVVTCNPSNVNLGGLDFWSGSFGPGTFNINTSGNVPTAAPFSWTASLYN
jgi:hypothetical protein